MTFRRRTALILVFLPLSLLAKEESRTFKGLRSDFNDGGESQVHSGKYHGDCADADGKIFRSTLTVEEGRGEARIYGFTLGTNYAFTRGFSSTEELTPDQKKPLAKDIKWQGAERVQISIAREDPEGVVDFSLFVKQNARKLVAYSYISSASYSLFGGVLGTPARFHHLCSYSIDQD